MITINGVKFAANEKEFTNSLFAQDGTANGYYKVLKAQIALYDKDKVKIGCINKERVLCSYDSDTKHYGYAPIKLIGEFESILKREAAIDSIWYRFYKPATWDINSEEWREAFREQYNTVY